MENQIDIATANKMEQLEKVTDAARKCCANCIGDECMNKQKEADKPAGASYYGGQV